MFAPNSDTLAAALQMTVHSALQQWLGERIVVEAVTVDHDDAQLAVEVQYISRSGQDRRVERFSRGAP